MTNDKDSTNTPSDKPSSPTSDKATTSSSTPKETATTTTQAGFFTRLLGCGEATKASTTDKTSKDAAPPPLVRKENSTKKHFWCPASDADESWVNEWKGWE